MDTKERRRRADAHRKKTAPRAAAWREAPAAPGREVPEVRYTQPKPLRRGKLVLQLLSMAAVVMAVMMGLSVFFRVETVMVSGAESYTPWMIREASGIEDGESLLSVREARIASRIQGKLPYVDEVKVSVTLPGTVNIDIRELQVTYAIQAGDSSWWLISSEGRVVEKTASAGSFTRVQGVKLQNPEPMEQAKAWVAPAIPDPAATEEATEPSETSEPVNPAPLAEQQLADERLAALLTVLRELEHNRIIGEARIIDVSDPTDIRLEFGQNLVVRLGGSERMSYKVAYMAAALDQLGENAGGDLDLTLQYAEEALYTPSGR